MLTGMQGIDVSMSWIACTLLLLLCAVQGTSLEAQSLGHCITGDTRLPVVGTSLECSLVGADHMVNHAVKVGRAQAKALDHRLVYLVQAHSGVLGVLSQGVGN
jgi:hypothetical protein